MLIAISLVAYRYLHLDEILPDLRSFLVSLWFKNNMCPIMDESINDGVVCLAFCDFR